MKCQLCEKEVEELYNTLYSNGERLMICSHCLSCEEAKADGEYERWKEEQNE